MKQYVVIGNGVAAVGCIEGIRSVDKDSKITVVSEENYPVYCRPLISYYLENKTDPERMNYISYYRIVYCDTKALIVSEARPITVRSTLYLIITTK